MKKLICLILLASLLCACLLPAVSAEEELVEVHCDEWKFSVRVPAGMTATSRSWEDPDTESVIGGGLVISAGGAEGPIEIRVIRRGRFYNVSEYLGGSFLDYIDREYGRNEWEECKTYRIGGKTMYGAETGVYGDREEEQFRELRLIPAGEGGDTEFIARYTAATRADTLSLMDTVIRYYQTDEEPEPAEAKFKPEGYEDGPDLQNGRYLLRVADADRIETDGYFTAILYKPDYYSPEDVHAMQVGDTILIMDRIMTITVIEPWGEDDGSWYEVVLYAADSLLPELESFFCLEPTEDGTKFMPYFGDDNHSASRIGEARIRVPQPKPVEYCEDEGDDIPVLLSHDLLADLGDDPAMFGVGWNEYTHRCTFADGNLIWVGTWPYPTNPEDLFIPW